MRARALHSRGDLLSLLQCPTTACERALRDDIVTLLGSFAAPGELPFYLVKVESVRGNVWYVGLRVNEPLVRYEPFWYDSEDDVPWEHWDGSVVGTNLLRNGDIPGLCELYRMTARMKHDTTPRS